MQDQEMGKVWNICKCGVFDDGKDLSAIALRISSPVYSMIKSPI